MSLIFRKQKTKMCRNSIHLPEINILQECFSLLLDAIVIYGFEVSFRKILKQSKACMDCYLWPAKQKILSASFYGKFIQPEQIFI